jgi:CheY-like chemotaxis protein
VANRAITIFPEGKSHSEPQMAELKTGAARIAFKAAKRGAAVKIVPVGLTYGDKHRFRSEVLIDIGQPIEVKDYLPKSEGEEVERVRQLTEKVADDLRGVTLNLEEWSDLPLINVAEQLYSIRLGEKTRDPARILLVDDDDDFRELLSTTLGREFPGASIESVREGAAALEAFDQRKHSVVLVDLQMPDVDGMEVTSLLRARDTARRVPIIVITASGGATDWRRLSEIGADGFLVKPVNGKDVVTLVRRALEERTSEPPPVA